jgi:hypothetical protein
MALLLQNHHPEQDLRQLEATVEILTNKQEQEQVVY